MKLVHVLAAGLLAMAQGAPPSYRAPMLACAGFEERVRSEIRSQSGGVVRDETAGREGVLVVRATPREPGLTVLLWYDSLVVWRSGPEGRQAPDTDGLLGGRWRGWLSSDGDYTPEAVPFIPDEVSELAELRGVANDFLPRLPPRRLQPGESAGDPASFRIQRLADGRGGMERYAWTRRVTADTTALQEDTASVPVRRRTEESGTMTWDPTRGPLGWERRLLLSIRIEGRGRIRRGIETVVRQTIEVTRQESAPECPGGTGESS